MTPTPTVDLDLDLDRLEASARGELGAKSLGEKLFDAMVEGDDGYLWSSVKPKQKATYERRALAFAASLTHDETANAVTLSLISALRASQQVAKEQADALAEFADFADLIDAETEGFMDSDPVALVLVPDEPKAVEMTRLPISAFYRARTALSHTRPSGGDAGGEQSQEGELRAEAEAWYSEAQLEEIARRERGEV